MAKTSPTNSSERTSSPSDTNEHLSEDYLPASRRTAFSIDSILSHKLTSDTATSTDQESMELKTKYSMSYRHKDSQGYEHEKLSALNRLNITSSLCPCETCANNGYTSTEEMFESKYPRVAGCYDPYLFAKGSSPLALLKYGTQDENERLINKRRRTIFTTSQLERLEYEFQHQQYIVGQERRYLAKQLGLNEIQVKVWFQNRRIKWRKFTHGNINMPDLSS